MSFFLIPIFLKKEEIRMELNEMEKRLLFQVEGDYQSKVLNELHMTARYIKNAEQKEAARRVIYRVIIESQSCRFC